MFWIAQCPLVLLELVDIVEHDRAVVILNHVQIEIHNGHLGRLEHRRCRGVDEEEDAVVVGIERRKVNWVFDMDIRGFFDAIDHEWLVRFVEHRIADKRVIRHIKKWLHAGVLDGDEWYRQVDGTPQGGSVSPLLANIYLHYVFDLWAHAWRQRASGDVVIIRYADDVLIGFQHEGEVRAFLQDLQERMGKFELALHPTKTRLIRFGRHAIKDLEKLGLGKPETFDFLGFTHFCTKSRKFGCFVIGRKTINTRMRATLRAIKMELRRRLHDPIKTTGAWIARVLKGHLNYFAVSGNDPSLWWFFNQVRWYWLRSLRRRSQKAFMNWEKYTRLVDRFFPPIRILHPQPMHRFDARTRGRSPVR